MAAENLIRITFIALISQFLISACSITVPLQYYIKTGKTDEALKEIDSGIEINSTNYNDYYSPIMMAAQLGNTVVAKKLLEKGVDLSHRSVNGVDALYIASANGKSEIVKLLLNYGADPNAVVPSEFPMKGKTALMGAVNNLRASEKSGRPSRRLIGRLSVVQLLVGAGAEIDKRGDYGSTALELAIIQDHSSMVEELIKLGADINQSGRFGQTPLTLAVSFGNLRAVEILLTYGADISQVDKKGKTPLMTAYDSDEYFIASYLKKEATKPKVDVDEINKNNSKSNLVKKSELLLAIDKIDISAVSRLLNSNNKISVDKKSKALTITVRKIVSKLIVTEGGSFSLRGQGEAFGGGVVGTNDPFKGMFGESKIQGLSNQEKRGLIEIVDLLLQAGANPNTYSVKGFSQARKLPVFGLGDVNQLSSAYPGVLVKDTNEGESALDFARLENNKTLIDLLKKYGAK